jgi:hypothetical protein
MGFMQDITQQAVLNKLSESNGERTMVTTITDDMGTATLKTATESLVEVTEPFQDRITALLKQAQSPERDAQLARQSKLQAVVEDAWANRIVKLGKR